MARRLTIEEALDYCLSNPDRLSVQQLLSRFPEHREKLEPLLTRAFSISDALPPPVPAERMAAMKQRLMDAAASGAVQRGTATVDLKTRPQYVGPVGRERVKRDGRRMGGIGAG